MSVSSEPRVCSAAAEMSVVVMAVAVAAVVGGSWWLSFVPVLWFLGPSCPASLPSLSWGPQTLSFPPGLLRQGAFYWATPPSLPALGGPEASAR